VIDATLLATPPGGDETVIQLYGTWVPRGGDNLLLTVELVANFMAHVDVQIFEKNYSDVGNGSGTGASVLFDGTTGRQTLARLGAKELVRVVLTITGKSKLPSDEVGWFLYRVLQPAWFEAVKA
jgi:hypothetical protein